MVGAADVAAVGTVKGDEVSATVEIGAEAEKVVESVSTSVVEGVAEVVVD